MFTARYAPSPYIDPTRFVFKGLMSIVVAARAEQLDQQVYMQEERDV